MIGIVYTVYGDISPVAFKMPVLSLAVMILRQFEKARKPDEIREQLVYKHTKRENQDKIAKEKGRDNNLLLVRLFKQQYSCEKCVSLYFS